MVLQYNPHTAKLANGDQIYPNEHVYVSVPWSERDGSPYNVARIIEFLPPHTTPKKGSRIAPSSEVMVRVSLYYRPSDISGRSNSDPRLLLAAIHTDIQPLSNVRGKCYVRHKDRIEDLIKWKKLPDHFYFVKFFDPYIKREFEVIRTENANNIPPKVKQVLMSRYEFLLTEREMVADLTESFKSCCVCEQWASSQESVRCEACKQHYHMSCLTPPLLAKPAKGYSWICRQCSLQRHKDVQEQKFHYISNGSAPSKPKQNAGKAKEKPVATGIRPDVTFRGWPWRYFGLYTKAEDTLDPDDLIFPRAATRVGQKYQAVVPDWDEEQAAFVKGHGAGHVEAEAGPSRQPPPAIIRGYSPNDRKHESTIELKSAPSDDLSTYMNNVAALKLPVPPYDVERLNFAIAAYTTMGPEKGMQWMRTRKVADFKPVVFSEKETAIFEEQLERNGGLETHETGKLLGRTPFDVLKFSYKWKNEKLKAENEALRHHHRTSTSHARQNKTLGAPSLGRIRPGAKDDAHSDDEVSLYGGEYVKENKMVCAACSTRIGTVWWRCPRTVPGSAMCENCGSNYRKYYIVSYTKAEDSKKIDKKDLAGKKSKGDVSGTATPVPPPPPKLPPCACCRRMEPKSMMARCKNCTFSVHAGCYGIASQDMGPEWECELCTNARLEENYLTPRCVLCPKDLTSVRAEREKSKPRKSLSTNTQMDFDILSALKPTEGRGWAHILCSTWIPEVVFAEPGRLKTVEGIVDVPFERWEHECSICHSKGDGAVIKCTDCETQFHPSCAWISGYKFGFEFSLAKPGRHQIATVTKFKDSEGVMGPGIWCKSHSPYNQLSEGGRFIYDLHEVDPEQNETALQIYVSNYKALPPHSAFPLLRKAQRLENLLPTPPPSPHSSLSSSSKECHCQNCGVDVSPLWHDVHVLTVKINGDADVVMMDIDEKGHQEQAQEQEKKRLCHLCYCNHMRN